jgi:hypothetical protein
MLAALFPGSYFNWCCRILRSFCCLLRWVFLFFFCVFFFLEKMKESRLGVGEFLDLAFKNIVPIYSWRSFMVVLGSARSRSYILGIVIFEEENSRLLQRFIVLRRWPIRKYSKVYYLYLDWWRLLTEELIFLERELFCKWQTCGCNEKQSLRLLTDISWIAKSTKGYLISIWYCVVFLLTRMNGWFNRGFEDCRGRISS